MDSSNATYGVSTFTRSMGNFADGWKSFVPLLSIVTALVSATVYLRSRNQKILPPGPRGWPLVGNVFDMPREREWLAYTEWGKTYGNIMSLSIFGRTVIILNSVKAANDLLHKRSSIYSDRPYFTMVGELVGYDRAMALIPYGNNFREMRRLVHQVLSPGPVQQFWPVEEQAAAKLLNRLVQTPENFVHHIRHTIGSLSLKISHGYTVSETGTDPSVALAEKTMDEFSLGATPGAFLVDVLPWLKYIPSWFPGAGFHRKVAKWRKNLYQMVDAPHTFTKDQISKGIAVPSFTHNLLEGSYTPETEDLVKWTAFSLYGGGVDTTVSTITSFFLAMCIHPEVQSTAQAELDAILRNERLPTMADRPSLPYVNALVKELLRWAPVVPGGIPHRLTQDDEYEGYRIPVGSIVVPNIWGMARNADVFPNPSEFCPERFMGSGEIVPPGIDSFQFAFGFGRRICPGQHLAESSIFLSVAMTLSAFTISKTRDVRTGEIVEPAVEWLPGLTSQPKQFTCDIKPRSTRVVNLIEQVVSKGEA